MTTIRDKLAAALTQYGFTPVQGRSAKFLTFHREAINITLHLGKAGALRSGPTVSDSHARENLRRILINRYDQFAATGQWPPSPFKIDEERAK